MIALLRQVADPGSGEGAQWAGMRIHLISNKIMDTLGDSSKMNAEWDFLSMLREEGRKAAESSWRAWRERRQAFHPRNDVRLEQV